MKIALAILAFVFLIYANTLGHPYFFDDGHYIVNNTALHTPTNLLRLWTSAQFNSISPEQWGYRPFTAFIHSLSWLAGGGATWPFHVVKILLHSVVCFLLFLVWRRLWSNPGFFPETAPEIRFKLATWDKTFVITPITAAAALAFVFAVHPANTQVLNYISATTTLLSGTCYLAAYYFYLRYRDDSRWTFILGSLGLYALAVLAKEEGITLCAVVLLTEITIPRRNQRKWPLIGYFITGLLLALLLRLMFVESSNIARGNVTRLEYFMTQWRAYLHFMKLLVWPWSLNADNLEFGFAKSFYETRVIAALCGNLILIALAWVVRNRFPVFLFSLIWFYIAISPASSIVPLAEPVNDHRMYLAYFGLVGIFPWLLKALENICRRPDTHILSPASGIFAALAMIGLIVGTEVRNQVWASQNSLWSDTVEKNPGSARALNNLALDYMNHGDWTRSLELLERCDQLRTNYPTCKVNQAVVFQAIGKDAEAEQKFREAIAADARRPESKFFFASFLMERGRTESALKLFQEIDQISRGQDLRAKLGWAKAAQILGRTDEANSVLQEALRRFGKQREIMILLGQGQS